MEDHVRMSRLIDIAAAPVAAHAVHLAAYRPRWQGCGATDDPARRSDTAPACVALAISVLAAVGAVIAISCCRRKAGSA